MNDLQILERLKNSIEQEAKMREDLIKEETEKRLKNLEENFKEALNQNLNFMQSDINRFLRESILREAKIQKKFKLTAVIISFLLGLAIMEILNLTILK